MTCKQPMDDRAINAEDETWQEVQVKDLKPGDQIIDPRNQAGWTVESVEKHHGAFYKVRAGNIVTDFAFGTDTFLTLRAER